MSYTSKATLRSISASRALAQKESDSAVAQYLGDGSVPLLPAAIESRGEEGNAMSAIDTAAAEEKKESKGGEEKEERRGGGGEESSNSSAPPISPSHNRKKKERKGNASAIEGKKEGGAKDPLSELVSFLPIHRRPGALSFLRRLAGDSRIHLKKNWIYEGEKKKGHIVAVLAAQFLPASSAENVLFFSKYKTKSNRRNDSVLPILEKTLRIATGGGGGGGGGGSANAHSS